MERDLTLSDQLAGYIDVLDSEDDREGSPDAQKERAKGKRMIDLIVTDIIRSREALTNSRLKSLELLVQTSPELIENFLNDKFAREAVDAVPGYVQRTMQLSRMEATRVPSHVTNSYLQEAARTFVFGFAQASIALSRAALEQAIRENLGYQGTGKFVTFQELIDEALKWRILDKLTARMARDLAKIGDGVLHEKPANLTQARDALDKLRGILQHIYSAEHSTPPY